MISQHFTIARASGRTFIYLFIWLTIALSLQSCKPRQEEKIVAPWGEIDAQGTAPEDFDLDQIVTGGELIMLTVSGPDTYYDYHGRSLGTQYMLCQKFADKLGVSLRVEVCRDTVEMVRRLATGDGDVIACPLNKDSLHLPADTLRQLRFCGFKEDGGRSRWVVDADKQDLARALDDWYKPSMLADIRKEETFLLSARSIRRHVYSPMLNRKGGIISRYDGLFATYAASIRWDWRLLAAQGYQESTFDPNARSWAGACGLMQIMPSTAASLGLPASSIHDPESNVAAAVKMLGQLERKFGDVPERRERIKFVLASYNGGYHHIRDAMALTRKYGGNPTRWSDVSRYVLLLSTPRYYRDPAVSYGYMRGQETVGYVESIHRRWESYRGVGAHRVGPMGMEPRRASHPRKRKYDI